MSRAVMVRCFVLGMLLLPSHPAGAQERYAVIVSGASGGPQYAAQYDRWSRELSRVLVEQFKFKPAAVTVLLESPQPDRAATAANVRRVFTSLGDRTAREDLVLVILIGHGTFDGIDAKFNLVGPDLESAEWDAVLQPLQGRLVVVNTSSASFPFLERLAGSRRIIITATDSAAQRFDTVFPEYFVRALTDDTSDLDKNDRISVWEAFWGASNGVRRHYQQRGLLATERPLLDDTGDGRGKDITDAAEDGSYASRTYLDDAPPGAAPTDEVLLRLLQRRALLMVEVEELKIRRRFLAADEYTREFERLMIELARVSQEVRARAGS